MIKKADIMKQERKCPPDLEHRQAKYKNNVIECNYGKLKGPSGPH